MPSSKHNAKPQAPSGVGTTADGTAAAGTSDDQRNSTSSRIDISADESRAVAVLSADLEGKIAGCNDWALKVLSCTFQNILGRQVSELISAENKVESVQLQKAILASVLQQGWYRSPHRCRTDSGEKFSGDLSVTLIRDGQSKPSELVVVISPEREKPALAPLAVKSGPGQPAPRTASWNVGDTKLVLSSPIMHQFMRMVDRVAGHTESVLITGETGVGKELIAHSIHQSSNRRNKPWVDINCAALPENLVESELFGYEKGAFTGADSSKPGLFELADKGTLFLDEIGELQLQTQVKLLRVLDGYPFYRLGGNRKIKVDVRIVAATNQDLDAAVAAGRFRQDLFHRLGQFQLRVPPLRERPEDIVAWAEHFLALKSPKSAFAPDAISALLSHPWLGNVRELRNLIARVAVESTGPEIRKAQITAAMSGNPVAQRQSASMPVGNLDSMEEQMIIRALERSGGHRSQAADQLGISRRTLSRKLKEYNINVNPGDMVNTMGSISLDQQKFFRARVELAVTLKNQQGYETHVQGVNLSTGGMGLDGLKEPMRFTGLLDVSFPLPESESIFQAKARIVWFGDEGRVGLRFSVIDPALFEQLQQWTNKKMKDEGWDIPG
ncbi:MAG: sigma 54-interacting transcriptional regulator [Candidatus Sulfotelmatobacter sp.]